jgi:hypothetical protein
VPSPKSQGRWRKHSTILSHNAKAMMELPLERQKRWGSPNVNQVRQCSRESSSRCFPWYFWPLFVQTLFSFTNSIARFETALAKYYVARDTEWTDRCWHQRPQQPQPHNRSQPVRRGSNISWSLIPQFICCNPTREYLVQLIWPGEEVILLGDKFGWNAPY